MRRAINPVAFLVLGIGLLWGFGIEALGVRLRAEVDGVVISRTDRHITGASRYSTEYIFRGWRLDYERDGQIVNDFPVGILEHHAVV
jgi:hypothetical protein